MYRGAFRRQLSLRTIPTSSSSASTWRGSSRHTLTTHRPRYLSTTTIPPPDQRKEPTSEASNSTLSTPPPQEQSSAPQAPPQETQHPSSSESSSEHGSSETNADKLALIKAQFKELSHETLSRMRDRGDGFTRQVARTFAQLGSELNRVTGYGEIEVLKRRVVQQEAKIHEAREAARTAKEDYDRAVRERAKSQREVNDLLQRKSHWTDEDVGRFTTLVREDHAREHDEARAKAAAATAEDAVEREFSELMRVILNRYHEEQAWSDKIRSASTYGSLAALALNMAVFVLAIVLVEPWKRRRLAQTFERKVEEMSAATADAFERRTGALAERLEEQGKLLKLVLETVHLSTQVSNAELASLGPAQDMLVAVPSASGSGRIPVFTKPEHELLLAATAGAVVTVVAGVVGLLVRSWYG
ncbi:Sensitive to high expression protein 9 -like protein, mitochondrial [Trametes pubescens]|uniref:Sensitive to high expression protein 9, mitochondrial n=1 Tax=Trametes pubescens TaxID=154538 RepID=A0A1M2W1A0_TRAPU|nr:Sensitive to high expression protein 9 -like protein, mitochondrial [Trametes pubescens]